MKNPNDLIKIPDYKKIRVIIDTDAACEADDPFAIAQALMSPKLIVRGILAEPFREPDSTKRSYDEIKTVLDAMDVDVPVFMGQKGPLETDDAVSPAAQFIIDEAKAGTGVDAGSAAGPLYILCQGAITNVAMALRACPEIKDKIIIVWIGTHGIQKIGKPVPFREFNA